MKTGDFFAATGFFITLIMGKYGFILRPIFCAGYLCIKFAGFAYFVRKTYHVTGFDRLKLLIFEKSEERHRVILFLYRKKYEFLRSVFIYLYFMLLRLMFSF